MNIRSLRTILQRLFFIDWGKMKHTISLNRNEQFLTVYRKGKRAYHKYFTLYYLPNGREENRLGFKVGKKLAKATKRNRLRRLMRECYRLSEESLKVGYDIILAAREGSLEINSYSDAANIFHKLFLRAELVNQNESEKM